MTWLAVAKVKEEHGQFEGQKEPSLLSEWVLNKGQVRKGGGHCFLSTLMFLCVYFYNYFLVCLKFCRKHIFSQK